MKTLNHYIKEKLIINKDYVDAHTLTPESFDELRNIIVDRYNKLGAGTKQNPIDFNDIDVSNIDSFYNKGIGIFEKTKFKHIDISNWNVSNVKSTICMFYKCNELESVGDLSNWDVSNVTNMSYMFAFCEKFNQDLSSWDVSNVTNMICMFYESRSFNQDISNWDVSKVRFSDGAFTGCSIKIKYQPKFK